METCLILFWRICNISRFSSKKWQLSQLKTNGDKFSWERGINCTPTSISTTTHLSLKRTQNLLLTQIWFNALPFTIYNGLQHFYPLLDGCCDGIVIDFVSCFQNAFLQQGHKHDWAMAADFFLPAHSTLVQIWAVKRPHFGFTEVRAIPHEKLQRVFSMAGKNSMQH